jgi:hypothetical protein
MLAYTMLISPSCLEQFVQADIQYANLSTSTWGEDNTTIEYGYDDNGSMTNKVTKKTSDGTVLETVNYEYNLQNKLSKVTTTPYEGGQPQTASVTEYKYDPEGNRVAKTVNGEVTNYFKT